MVSNYYPDDSALPKECLFTDDQKELVPVPRICKYEYQMLLATHRPGFPLS